MSSNKSAILGAIKILADGAKDVVAALEPGQTLAQKVLDFENLVPDALAEVQVIGDIGAEIQALSVADISELAGALVSDLAFSDVHSQAIAQASLKVLQDAAGGMVPDLLHLFGLVKPAVKAA